MLLLFITLVTCTCYNLGYTPFLAVPTMQLIIIYTFLAHVVFLSKAFLGEYLSLDG